MCAIFGIVGTYDKHQAQQAFDSLSHRGGDESASIQETDLFLGIHRLAITAVNTPSIQPIQKVNIRFVMNGEIYNYHALAQELNIQTNSDTEVAYAAYEKWGDDFVKHLRGMFAIAVIEANTLKLFRDPFGKKPLYYALSDGNFYFASELKAIQMLLPAGFNTDAIPAYFSYQSPIAPQTFHSRIALLPAGSVATYDRTDKQVKINGYYTPLSTPITIFENNEAVQKLHNALQTSVALRIPEEISCGALLSGGLDSSLVAAMAAKHTKLHTFSIGYDSHAQHDERPYAAQVAKHIGSEHHEVNFTKEDFLSSLNEIVSILDEPLADPAMIPLFHLMKQIRKTGIKVVLTGDGSDELFLGYKPYKEFLDLEQLSHVTHKNWMRNFLRAHFSMNKEWEWHKRIFEESLLFRSSAELFSDLQQNRLLRMNVRDNDSLRAIDPFIKEFEKSGRTDPVDWYGFIDLKIQLGEVFLRKLDRISMAHTIEARTPFLDKQLVESVFGIDPALRRKQMPKNWIREIAEDYLPREIIYRKKKGFNYPYMQWLHESGEIETIQRLHQKRKFFRDEHLAWLLEQNKQGKFDHQVFALYMFCKWAEAKLH